MPKLKRKKDAKRSSVMVKGKERFRTHKEANEAKAAMDAYVVETVQIDTVKLLASNNTPKKDILKLFDISETAFDNSALGKAYQIGKVEKGLKVTQRLFEMTQGTEGIWDAKKKRWVVHPRGPDLGACIWWDKSRNGMSESSSVTVKGRGMGNTVNNVQQNVILYIPPNGRESGARGDPTYVLREQQRVIEQQKAAER